VSASLRLRCRSAAFAVARWDFISILLSQNERNPLLRGRATDFCSKSRFFARRSLSRLKLPYAGGVRVTPAGQSDTTYRLISSARFFDARPRDSSIFG